MTNYMQIFKPEKSESTDEELVSGALNCLDRFGECFNSMDFTGMDEMLHFPHYVVSGSTVIEWRERGQLPEAFFNDLVKQGWHHTSFTTREVILVSTDKVHFRIRYTRERKDNSILTAHENIWIVTRKNGRWGILLRSY
jgi:hypothetical protein